MNTLLLRKLRVMVNIIKLVVLFLSFYFIIINDTKFAFTSLIAYFISYAISDELGYRIRKSKEDRKE